MPLLSGTRWLLFCLALRVAAQVPDADFFEKSVRPVLAGRCQSCHGAKMEQGGLRLDSRAALLRGGARGPALVPGDPDGSLLVKAIRHDGLKMPLGGKLPPAEINALTRWIEKGAQWPAEAAVEAGVKPISERAREFWAFQPVTKPPLPPVSLSGWARTPVDRFVLAGLEKSKLTPAAGADRTTLIRRLSLDLTGLPPRPEEVLAFVEDRSPEAYEMVVDRLLRSPRFGEQWARHWMDLVRYSESHGSQGDFDLPNAYQYRDYLIRALNRDVPYDQLVREHLAGDLLPQPRLNPADKINESAIGPAHFRMVEYGYVPVDALDDQFKVVDNQIDVISKAFQGLTVSCARCHDHKFDPISQKDFYALYGVLASSRHGQRVIDTPERLNLHRPKLEELRTQLRRALGQAWRSAQPDLSADLPAPPPPRDAKAAPPPAPDYGPLRLWRQLKDLKAEEFQTAWTHATAKLREQLAEKRDANARGFRRMWSLDAAADYQQWFREGNGLAEAPAKAGEFYVLSEGDRLINGIYPAGTYSHLVSRKHAAVLHSPRFKIDSDSISVRVLGGQQASVRVVVENYALGNGGIFPGTNLNDDTMRWIRFDTKYRRGSYAYLELTPFEDRTRLPGGGPADGRSHFGVADVVFHDGDKPPEEVTDGAVLLLDGPAPESAEALSARYRAVLRRCLDAWLAGAMSPEQAAFLDFFVRHNYLPNSRQQSDAATTALVDQYRKLEAEIPVPRRVPGLLAGTSFDQPLFQRGNHMNPGPPVARRFLEALGSQPCASPQSGRLELAEAMASATNPLTSRVIVNRIWHHLFGRGLVRTVDNFGRNGEKPSHPELLNYLAARFVEDGWSIKRMVKLLVTSSVYQLSSSGSAEAAQSDSGNVLLQHARTRRLTGEAIRDSILAVSGDLDTTLYGPGIDVYYTGKTEGGGKVGPLDGARRRSVYQRIKRNAQNPFLEVFDVPKPTSTRGQRDATNVPAQSLTMLNDPFVIAQAARWADRMVADGGTSARDRVERMFVRALGRRPAAAELTASLEYLAPAAVPEAEILSNREAWQDFAHSLFNLKEFLYVR